MTFDIMAATIGLTLLAILLWTAYRLGYTRGQIDQMGEESKRFLQSLMKNRADEQ